MSDLTNAAPVSDLRDARYDFAELVGFVPIAWSGGPSDAFFNINTAADLEIFERPLNGSEI